MLTMHAVLAWISEHTPCGELREAYISDPRKTPPDQLVTHVMLKIEENE